MSTKFEAEYRWHADDEWEEASVPAKCVDYSHVAEAIGQWFNESDSDYPMQDDDALYVRVRAGTQDAWHYFTVFAEPTIDYTAIDCQLFVVQFNPKPSEAAFWVFNQDKWVTVRAIIAANSRAAVLRAVTQWDAEENDYRLSEARLAGITASLPARVFVAGAEDAWEPWVCEVNVGGLRVCRKKNNT